MLKESARWPLDKPFEELIGLIRDAANVVRQGEDSQVVELKNNYEGWIAAIYTTRCTRNLRAVAMLCEAGYASEAVHIVRAMLEDAVTMAYIEQDNETRAAAYAEFQENRAYFYVKEALRADLADEQSERVRELTERFADAEDLETVWWSGLKPSGMAGKLKGKNRPLKRDFFAMYPVLSDDAHGNAMSSRNYLIEGPKGTPLAFIDAPTQYRVDEMACLAIYSAWRLVQAAQACGLGVHDEGVAALLEKASSVYRALNNSAGAVV